MSGKRPDIVVTDGVTPGSLPPGRHPLVDGIPEAWMDAWGEDDFGVFAEFAVGDVRQRMRWVPAGTFRMEDQDADGRWLGGESPKRIVTLSRGYWLGETPVTQALWARAMPSNPSYFKGETLPVESVSWHEAQQFIAAVNRQLNNLSARLPTEAEWERACRAGSEAARYGPVDEVAWRSENSSAFTHAVKGKLPNALGIYDMLGNVWEWCADWSGGYEVGAVVDPEGSATGHMRVVRGGAWYNATRFVRAAYRSAGDPDGRWRVLGFRLARSHPA